LVQQIIDLSRLQADVLGDDQTALKGDELVAEPAAQTQTHAEARDIAISVAVEPHLHLRGDRAQLAAALGHLVANAGSYSPEHSPVAVTAKGDRGDVRLTVTDQGIGISPEEQERIFERFYRVDPARARATGGTGLGLSIVKHVVAGHGG